MMGGGSRYFAILAVGLTAAMLPCCSWIRSGGESGADALARGARIVAVNTARAGALIGKGTYAGGRKAVTWTSSRTVDGTQATLDMLGLSERPVPPDVLERLPDGMLDSLSSLEFVDAGDWPEQVVISSPDSRWEGELFYRVPPDGWISLAGTGPRELIVVSMVCFPETGSSPADRASYSVSVREDQDFLGEVRFETLPYHLNCIYGEKDLKVSHPGVFIVRVPEGLHSYRFNIKRDNGFGPGLIAFFYPRYGSR